MRKERGGGAVKSAVLSCWLFHASRSSNGASSPGGSCASGSGSGCGCGCGWGLAGGARRFLLGGIASAPLRGGRISRREGMDAGGRFGGEEPSTSRRGKFSNGVLAKSGGCGEERTAKSSVSERTSSPMNVTTAQCVTKRAHPSWPMHGMHRPSCFLLFFPFFLNFFPKKKKMSVALQMS
jgi:hypothetical protein